MTIPGTINLLGGLAALACVGAIPLWILGIPGTSGPYATGWSMGFQVLWMYPAAFLINLICFFVLRKMFGPERLDWSALSSGVTLVLLAMAVVRLVTAFKTMR